MIIDIPSSFIEMIPAIMMLVISIPILYLTIISIRDKLIFGAITLGFISSIFIITSLTWFGLIQWVIK